MIQVGQTIDDFRFEAYHDGQIKRMNYRITKASGWCCCFIRLTLPLFARRNWKMPPTIFATFKKSGPRS